ncbi:MAG: hypothetical protein Q7S36_02195 [Candidatus Liptonbacteria bacterium]|nr:hypothetical protein [Candidatus Liptonbacteria bacterium]
MKTNKKQRHLVVGAGEVGRAVYNVLSKKYDVSIRDKSDELPGRFDVLHVTYPPIKNFLAITKKYIKTYRPSLVIIHSTVPVGLTRQIGKLAVHSPIRGVHPRLEAGIMTFEKYFGGPKAKEAGKIFSDLGIKAGCFPKAETTELMKILDTTYYGWNIMFSKEAKRLCDKFGVDFEDAYTRANKDYNEAYTRLGMPHVVRPVLRYVKGKIGGHCVTPNTKLLDDWLTNTLKSRNKKY